MLLVFFGHKPVEILLLLQVFYDPFVDENNGFLQVGSGPELFYVCPDAGVGGGVEGSVFQYNAKHARQPEVPVVVAKVAPADKMPGRSIMERADSLYPSEGA